MDEDQKRNQILYILKQIEDEVKHLEQEKEAIQAAVQKRISEIKLTPTPSSRRRNASVKPSFREKTDNRLSFGNSQTSVNSHITTSQKTKDTPPNQNERGNDLKPNKKRSNSVRRYRPKVDYNINNN